RVAHCNAPLRAGREHHRSGTPRSVRPAVPLILRSYIAKSNGPAQRFDRARIAGITAMCSISSSPAPAGAFIGCKPAHYDSIHAVARGPVVRSAKQAGAGGLHRGDLSERVSFVFGAAPLHQDGAAAAGRFAGGVVRGDGVFSVALARWLRVCARFDADEETH